MNHLQKYLSTCLLATGALLVGASPAWAKVTVGAASGFAVLAGTAVTCTDSTVTGDVGAGTVFTDTKCKINGTVHAGDAAALAAYNDFLIAYAALAPKKDDRCTIISGDLAGQRLTPGVYCVEAASTTTGGVLTLVGSSNDIWIFKIGTLGTGALTGTDFSVVMEGGGQACNVTWWVAQAATLTRSVFLGTILAGADITVTGGTFNGDVLAGGAGSLKQPTGEVTLTNATVTGCEGGSRGGTPKSKCNQGIGNGPEQCDPGNSNQQGNPSPFPSTRSNDELGGAPRNPGPGRKGGNTN